ncbi:MAG: cold shock and DUF1294 domain-containing protein [Gammaproteobacteria bacterium]|nr:cold shock and DUF1294 domain-containing protein [Gammaproteobacteria bacterium]
MRYQGRITDWKDDKGFGFITPNAGGANVFIHIKAFSKRGPRPSGNELVTYEVVLDPQRRPQAANVSFVVARKNRPPSRDVRLTPASAVLPVLMFCFVGLSVAQGKLHALVLVAYLALSCVAYLLYAFDKAAAMQGQWRTQESTLHLMSALGGWPGAMMAQSMFRHKTRKVSFRVAFWATVIINCVALAWLRSPHGMQAVAAWLAGP